MDHTQKNISPYLSRVLCYQYINQAVYFTCIPLCLGLKGQYSYGIYKLHILSISQYHQALPYTFPLWLGLKAHVWDILHTFF